MSVVVENYAPVHLVLHSFEWRFFGTDVFGYHVVNVLLHALAASLLTLLYRRSGVSAAAAIWAAAFFLVHPANVEAVAWISQLKSSSALVLSLGALLLHPRRPAWACLLFALALFAKPFSAVALVVAALFSWLRSGDAACAEISTPARAREESSRGWRWLGAWLAITLLFAAMEASAFARTAGLAPPLYADLAVRLRTVFSIALRYLVMAATGSGLSAFHEPPPVLSYADPWLLWSLALLALLGLRLIYCLRARSEEAVYWIWAAASFAPLSGVLPLPYPMADRYLYFILPGLLGASTFVGGALLDRVVAWRGGHAALRRQLAGGALLVCTLLLVPFAVASHSRAALFQSADRLMADAERPYPTGAAAQPRKARRAARAGAFVAALAHLRPAHPRGYNRLAHLLADPSYGPMRSYEPFVELEHEMARDWIERLGRNPDPSQVEARALAQAYIVADDLPKALKVIERAIEHGGPIGEDLRSDAEKIRRRIRRRQRLDAKRLEPRE